MNVGYFLLKTKEIIIYDLNSLDNSCTIKYRILHPEWKKIDIEEFQMITLRTVFLIAFTNSNHVYIYNSTSLAYDELNPEFFTTKIEEKSEISNIFSLQGYKASQSVSNLLVA
jgi:hypothetical protein